jgi:hypothetical protein
MAGFAKVFETIVTSTIWCEPDYILRVWIAMLVRADSNGIVEGSLPGFASLARVSDEQMRSACDVLSAPDPNSRTQDHEGRRIQAIEGGWVILNYEKYRQKGTGKDAGRAPYMRAYRARKRVEAFKDGE